MLSTCTYSSMDNLEAMRDHHKQLSSILQLGRSCISSLALPGRVKGQNYSSSGLPLQYCIPGEGALFQLSALSVLAEQMYQEANSAKQGSHSTA